MPSHAIHPIDIIRKKRHGEELTQPEIEHFVHTVVLQGERTLDALHGDDLAPTDKITDAQIAAFLMAVYMHGLTHRELAWLTTAMRYSGETFNMQPLNTFSVDKHSTGGVGDKSSLLIAPIVAAAGLEGTPSISVPMISGRSLGHTGGTLDKLETIPGFDTQLNLARMTEVLRETHATMVGQTPRLVPADRLLYAMRDHTGTVESPYLITASIMSKKLAEDLNGLVLDVKVGSGAFMPTYEKSEFLAKLMVSTGELAGTRTAALLTTMDEPMGRFSGNWIEVWECVDILQNKRHPMSADLIQLSTILSGWMLYFAGKSKSPEEGAKLADDILLSGAAYKSWLQIVTAHKGDTSIFADPAAFHQPKASRVLKAPRAGYLSGMDCTEVGWAVQRLGAGRAKPGAPVSAHAGIESHAKIGTHLQAGDPIFTLYSEDEALLDGPYKMLEATIQISDTRTVPQPLIREIITRDNTSI